MFGETILRNQPHTYWILTSDTALSPDWVHVPEFVTPQFVYFPGNGPAIYSSSERAAARDEGDPFELLCLSCFLHLLRIDRQARSGVLDDRFPFEVMSWRNRCESTAVYRGDQRIYRLEGCRHSGCFWVPSEAAPRSEPPFVSCGALDQNGGCWGTDCESYLDDEFPDFPRDL